MWWRLWSIAVAIAMSGPVLFAADPVKDTPSANFTRTKKLKGKVTVDQQNQPLKEILEDISLQLQDQRLGPIVPQYDVGISGNTRTTLTVKDVPAEEALDKLFGSLQLGYYVVSQENSRYDGWIKIVKGNARGYLPGTEPKDVPNPATPPKLEPKPTPKQPTDPVEPLSEEELAAVAKLNSAKKLIEDQKTDDAKKLLKYVTKFYPTTKAATEAKKLLDEMK